jgi:SAM-dependent methyltransferase
MSPQTAVRTEPLTGSCSAEPAYDLLAPHYDAFTAGDDYEAWTATLERLARAYGLAGDSLLDCACGTGKSFLPFLARGWRVTACDISQAMLARARGKCPDPRVRLIHADVRALPAVGRHDLVTCLDDGLNYLLEPADLVAGLASMRRCTRPGGLVLFDLNTAFAYRRHFLSSSALEAGDGRLFVWRACSEGFAGGATATADLDVFTPDGAAWTRTSSRHTQRHHPPAAVRRAAARAGLEVLAVRGLTRDGALHDPLDERRHTKSVWVLRRPETERR